MNDERTIGLASTSLRRRKALEEIPDREIVVVGGGEEPQIDDLLTIALGKIAFAYPSILQLCQEKNRDLDGVTAADTHTLIGVWERGLKLISKGKPKELKTTQRYFQRMAEAAEYFDSAYYEVASSSAFQDETGTIGGTEVTKINVKKDKIDHIATDEGFESYLAFFNAFYRSNSYVANGLSHVTPLDLSGGISLPVLLKMKAVESIDGVRIDDKDTRLVEDTVKKAILNVAVSFSPRVLERIHPQALTYLLEWNWLNGVMRESLD